jgi:exopolysaccharide biosynthesis polyprenyl glycosylphosphotransferase
MSIRRSILNVPSGLDGIFALAILVSVVCYANHQSVLQSGLTGFVGIRITLLNAIFSLVFVVLWQKCFRIIGLYRSDLEDAASVLLRLTTACTVMTGFVATYLKLRAATEPIRLITVEFFVISFCYELVRVLLTNPQTWQPKEPALVIILGSGPRASKAWRELRVGYHGRKKLLGFFDDRDQAEMAPDIATRYLGPLDELSEYLLKNVVDELIVATPLRSCYDMTQRAVSLAEAAGVRVSCLNEIFNLSLGSRMRRRASLFVELVPADQASLTAEKIKRLVDLFGASLALILTAPIFLAAAIAVKATSPGPVFFVQERYGFGRRRFSMFKFRSMVQDAPELMARLEAQNEARGPIFKMANDPRVTAVGRFLRRTSIDELPQLLNVIKGDMSLVGPRPMSVRDVSLFTEAQLMRRFSVRPGITGSWQVSARSSLDFDQWVLLDCSYIENWSLALDLSILVRTIPAVLKRSGAV